MRREREKEITEITDKHTTVKSTKLLHEKRRTGEENDEEKGRDEGRSFFRRTR